MSALKNRNKEYNETRKRQSDLKKKDINHDRALQRIHEDSASRIQSQIDNFYLKYATSDGLTVGEARKRASDFDVTQYFDKAKKAVADKDFTAETNAWLKDYNRKMRISRLEVLQGEIQLELLSMTEKKAEYVLGALDDSLKSEYAFQRKKIQEQLNKHRDQAGILNMSTRSPIDKYKGIINADFYGNNFSDRLWGYAMDMDRDITNSLSRIYTDMMGFQTERDRLKRTFNVTDYEAQRLLRTEMRRVNSQLQEEMLKDNGFTHMIYVTEPGACEICAPLENKAIPIEDIEIGMNQPPMHPNCYCSMYGHIEMVDIYGNSSLDEFDKFDESDIPNLSAEEQAEIDRKRIIQFRTKTKERMDNSDFSDTLTKAQYKKFMEEFDSIDDMEILQMYHDYVGEVYYSRGGKGSYYSPKYNTVNIKPSSTHPTKERRQQFGVIHHEMGHAFDTKLFERMYGTKTGYNAEGHLIHELSSVPGYELKEKIIRDYENTILNRGIKELGPAPPKMINGSFNDAYDEWDIAQSVNEITKKNNLNEFVKEFTDYGSKSRENQSTMAALSDILESTGQTPEHPMVWGHGEDYWGMRNGEMRTSEFFAHATQLKAHNEEGYKVLKKYFPESTATYEDMVTEALGK